MENRFNEPEAQSKEGPKNIQEAFPELPEQEALDLMDRMTKKLQEACNKEVKTEIKGLTRDTALIQGVLLSDTKVGETHGYYHFDVVAEALIPRYEDSEEAKKLRKVLDRVYKILGLTQTLSGWK